MKSVGRQAVPSGNLGDGGGRARRTRGGCGRKAGL